MPERNTRKDLLERAAKLGIAGAARMNVATLRQRVLEKEGEAFPAPGPSSLLEQMDVVVRLVRDHHHTPTRPSAERLEESAAILEGMLAGVGGSLKKLANDIVELANAQLS